MSVKSMQRSRRGYDAACFLTLAGRVRMRLEVLEALLARDWATVAELARALDLRATLVARTLAPMARDGLALARPRDGGNGAAEYQADRASPVVKLAQLALELAAEQQRAAAAA